MTPMSIIIADDHLLFIEGIKALLEHEKEYNVIGVANNGLQLLSLLDTVEPDAILLDINMPLLNGLDAMPLISEKCPEVKIIILSTYSESHFIQKAKTNGAQGYLLKDCNKDELVEVLKLVYNGEYALPELSQNKPFINDSFSKITHLTKRELEIVQLIKCDYTNKQIADKLFLSLYTVETHRKNIMKKLGLTKPQALIKFLIEANL